MNWDAIRAAALIVIAAFSAIAIGIQTVLKVRERERNQILEEVQKVLTPTIHHLKEEIKAIEENKIWWHRHTSGRCDFQERLSKLIGSNSKEYSGAARDVFSKFPDLNGRFSSHDDLYDKLNDIYAKIENEVKIPALEERLTPLVNKFNESRDSAHRLSRDFFEKPELMWGEFIINYKYPRERMPDTIQPHIDFWEAYRDELLVFRNTSQIKELDKEIEGLLRQLKELDEELSENLEKIREKYRVKFKFIRHEINHDLRETEEW